MKRALNVGSGQRPFTTTPEVEWINIDSQERWNPDICCNAANLPFLSESVDYVVLHHLLEHFNLGDGDGLIREAFRVLTPGGSLWIFIPNAKKLADAWLHGRISDYIYFVNTYGAFMGSADDIHKWNYTWETLKETASKCGKWSGIFGDNGRSIPGADIARDWWILGMECIK